MIRLIAVAFALTLATSAQAMSPPPLHQPDGMTTQVGEDVARVGHESMACAWPKPPTAIPPRIPQVCAMEWRRLRWVLLRRPLSRAEEEQGKAYRQQHRQAANLLGKGG